MFEGIRAYRTEKGVRIFKAREHYERLRRSCELVHIPFNWNPDELISVSHELLEKNKFGDAYIRPLIFCSPNMSLNRPLEVHLLICAWEWGAYLGDHLLRLKISSFCRPHPASLKVEAKVCGHYVNSILATIEAKDQGYDEALLLDHEGFLAEGPGANLFFGSGNELCTPAPGNILPGITRSSILEIAKGLGLKTVEGKFLPEDLFNADYAFYCGTAAEVIGIGSVNGRPTQFPWSGSPGDTIRNAYHCLVREQTFKQSLIKA